MQRPPDDADRLYASDDPDQIVPHPDDPQREPGQPRLFIGPIASANKLLKNPRLRDELRDQFGVKAVEMEGSGVADATWTHEVGYLVVRGICDYCDSHKNDAWQGYAAVVAAAYTRGLLASMPAEETETPAQNPSIFNQSGQVVHGNQINVAGNYVDHSTTTVRPAGGTADRAQTEAYNTAAVRDLLNAAFSDDELMALCFDHFREVYNNLSSGMSKGQKIQQLLDHCIRREQIPALLAEVQARNPAQYRRFAGQVGGTPGQSTRSAGGEPRGKPVVDEDLQNAASLQSQLADARENLRIIDEQIAKYVQETDVDVQLIKQQRRWQARIAELERQLGLKP